MTNRYAMRGFTLLEVLVVLMVVSLISVVLMQGLGLILRLRGTFGDQMVALDRETVKRNFVRQPLAGLMADFNDGDHQFSGTEVNIKGLTAQPLLRRSGRPIPFAITLSYDEKEQLNTLWYREDEDEPVSLAAWVGQPASFKYMGIKPGWLPEWPGKDAEVVVPGQITDVRLPQLPELIYLDTGSEQEIDYAIAVQARRNRVPRDPPMFMGAGTEN